MMHHCRYIIAVLMLLATPLLSVAQLSMQVLDATTREPVSDVKITNRTTKTQTRTDKQGHFSLLAAVGDTLLCAHPFYNFSVQYITEGKTTIFLYPRVHKLQEVEVMSDMARFQRDSAERRALYRKTILDSRFKPSIPKRQGLKLNGLVTAFAYKVSGKSKKNKKFVAQMEANEREQYVQIRYTPALVESLTSLRNDSTRMFMERYPMNYEFARSASDLDIKLWVRANYRQWIAR